MNKARAYWAKAFRPPGAPRAFVKEGQENRQEHRDDADDHKQFTQRKGTVRHESPPSCF